MSIWKPTGQGLWVRPYDFRGNCLNTLVIALGDGGLAALSPGTQLEEAEFAALDALGTVKALVSPGAFHNLGFPSWSKRYPDAGLYCPADAIVHIAKQHPSLKPLEDLGALAKLLPDDVRITDTPGMKQPDAHVVIRREDGITWFTNECITNNASLPPNFVFATLFRLTGSGPGLNVNTLAMKLVGGKKPILRDYWLEQLAADPPTRLVPCHGDVIDDPALATRLREVIQRRIG